MLKAILHYDCYLGSIRPFFTTFLYAVSFRLSNFGIYTPFYLGILAGSLLIPIYYVIISNLFNGLTALFSSLVLVFMTNYIEQSLALSPVMLGIIFLSLSLMFTILYYKSPHRLWHLYLSGFFLTMSVFCRYENALFIPPFMLYNLLFDKKSRLFKKVIYWIICLASSVYICVCNFKNAGGPFAFICKQNINALSVGHRLGFLETGLVIRELLYEFFAWPVWVLGVVGIFFMIIKYKSRALAIFSSLFIFCLFVFYKSKNGTMSYDANYFLVIPLMIIPVAFESVRMLLVYCFKKNVYACIVLGIMTGLLIWKSNNQNLAFEKLKYSQELVKITKGLADTVGNRTLYITNAPGWGPPMLFYLKRNPVRYSYGRHSSILEEIFYLFIAKDRIDEEMGDKKWKLLRDYGDLGLYEITNYE